MVVVGGTSFIGRHVLGQLSAAGAEVVATYRGAAAPPVGGVQWVRTDLASAAAPSGCPSSCDAVIYLAQSRRWRQFPDGAADVFAVNVRGVFTAIEYARRAGASRFVFASSGSVYGTTGATLESQPLDVEAPRPFYVAGKLAAEVLLTAYRDILHLAVLRLFVPYGTHQDPEMLVPQIVRRVREGRAVTLDGDDGLAMNPVAAWDVAEAMTRVLQLDRSVTLNVAGPEVIRLREMAERIGEIVGRPPVFERRDRPAPLLVGDTSALAAALGWRPATTPAAGLRRWLADEQRG